MINWLSQNPGVLLFLNCCAGPIVCVVIGYLIAIYRPRLRMPVTMDRPSTQDSEF